LVTERITLLLSKIRQSDSIGIAPLAMDGGDMEILGIKENGENFNIYVRYLGACSGCASADTGTLFAIENILKEK